MRPTVGPGRRSALGAAAALGVFVGAVSGAPARDASAEPATAAAATKAPAKKPPARKSAPKKKGVVGLDLPPLPKGKSCYEVGKDVPEPALLKNAEVEVPARARGGTLRSALLVYDVLVDKAGRIAEVKTVGQRSPEPPWPELHDAAIVALKNYKYAKTVVRGAAAPVCLIVSLNLDLR